MDRYLSAKEAILSLNDEDNEYKVSYIEIETKELYIVKIYLEGQNPDFYMSFNIGGLSANCGICLCRVLTVPVSFIQSNAHILCVKAVEKFAKFFGYSIVMYTTANYQRELIQTLSKQGWDKLVETKNRNSGNMIAIWTKILDYG